MELTYLKIVIAMRDNSECNTRNNNNNKKEKQIREMPHTNRIAMQSSIIEMTFPKTKTKKRVNGRDGGGEDDMHLQFIRIVGQSARHTASDDYASHHIQRDVTSSMVMCNCPKPNQSEPMN